MQTAHLYICVECGENYACNRGGGHRTDCSDSCKQDCQARKHFKCVDSHGYCRECFDLYMSTIRRRS